MKSRILVAGLATLALAALSGCAGGVNANKAIGQADNSKSLAEELKINPTQIESANAKLDSAKALQADGEDEQAIALAEQSDLEYKLSCLCHMVLAASGQGRRYGLDADRLARMADHAIVMHPGPMVRGMEISAEVADSARSTVTEQVTNGVSVRMAVLYLLLGGAIHRPGNQGEPR